MRSKTWVEEALIWAVATSISRADSIQVYSPMEATSRKSMREIFGHCVLAFSATMAYRPLQVNASMKATSTMCFTASLALPDTRMLTPSFTVSDRVVFCANALPAMQSSTNKIIKVRFFIVCLFLYYLICNLRMCGRIPLLFKKGCPKGGVVI